MWLIPDKSTTIYPSYYKPISSPTKASKEQVKEYVKINDTPKSLRPGIFLICGACAWQSVPCRAFGGPCYFGKLTMCTPRMSRIKNITHLRRGKRSIRYFDKNCKDNVKLMGLGGRTALSFFVPDGMAASNTRNLAPLAFWGEEQFNLTSEMISDLDTDADSVRHATLQSRAATDLCCWHMDVAVRSLKECAV